MYNFKEPYSAHFLYEVQQQMGPFNILIYD